MQSHRSWLRHLISTSSRSRPLLITWRPLKWKPCLTGASGRCSTCLEQPRLYALSPMIVSDVAEGVRQVLVSPPDFAQADFQFDPKKFRFSEHEILLQCKSNVKEFPIACGGDFTVTWRCIFTALTPQKMAKSMTWCKPNSDGRTRTRRCITIAPQRSSSTQGSDLGSALA